MARLGFIKSLGVSNFDSKQLKALLEMPSLTVKPVVRRLAIPTSGYCLLIKS